MLKPSDLTKAELLQVVEMLAFGENEYYLDRALGRIEMQRNDAHYRYPAGRCQAGANRMGKSPGCGKRVG